MEKIASFLLLLPLLCVAIDKPSCIPDCVANAKSPNDGGPMCRCTTNIYPPGCQVSPCKNNEDSAKEYTCMCSPDSESIGCVNPRCDNSTLSASNAGTGAGVITTTCNNPCNCRIQPPDCTASSGDPSDGNPACTCTQDNWKTGCTMRPCRLGDNHDLYWFCECTKDYAPSFCYTPLCT